MTAGEENVCYSRVKLSLSLTLISKMLTKGGGLKLQREICIKNVIT
jgi:hypothetical protein